MEKKKYDEDTEEILHKLIKEQMKNEHTFQFDCVHRFGKKTTNSDRPRPIVDKLSDTEIEKPVDEAPKL